MNNHSISDLMAYSEADVQAVRNVIAPNAPDEIIRLVIFRCRQLGADPMGKAIYAINRPRKKQGVETPKCPKENCSKPLRKSKDGGWYCWKQTGGCGLNISDDHPLVAGLGDLREDNWVLQCSIDFFRSQAESCGDYAGQDGPYWCGADGVWRDVWLAKEKPAAARVGILRRTFAQTLWSTALMSEYDQNENLWKTRAVSQLAKCCEAAGLRRAFPEKLNKLYLPDEIRDEDEEGAEETPRPALAPARIELPPGLVQAGMSVGMMPLGIQRDLEKVGNAEELQAQYIDRAAKQPHRQTVVAPSAHAAPTPPPTPQEKEFDEDLNSFAKPKSDAPLPSQDPKKAVQRARMAFDSEMAKRAFPTREARLDFGSWAIGRKIASFSDLSLDECEMVIRALVQRLAENAPPQKMNTENITCPACGAEPGVAHWNDCELA